MVHAALNSFDLGPLDLQKFSLLVNTNELTEDRQQTANFLTALILVAVSVLETR